MRIMLTGARGFIARSLIPELEAGGHEVIATDIEDGDLTVSGIADGLVKAHRPDAVVHLAAAVSRILCEDDREDTVRANPVATMHVARAASRYGARFVYTSTSEVYGDHGDAWVDETTNLIVSHNLYGMTKYWGEQVAQLYAGDGLQIVRPSMPFGPSMPVGRGCCAIVNFLWWAATRQPIVVHDGSARCWCWVGDLVRAFRLVIESGEQASSSEDSQSGTGVYNIGRDDNEQSMVEIARIACGIVDTPDDLVDVVQPPEAQTLVKRLSMAKVRSLGYTPATDPVQGLQTVFEQDFADRSTEELLGGAATSHRLART